MSEAKIDIKIGPIQFSGQGEQDWIAKQLDKILGQAEKLAKLAPTATEGEPASQRSNDESAVKMSLAVFLKSKGAAKNQSRKFLATAVWLHAKGKERLQAKDVTEALREANQSRLGNARDTLAHNVGKGLCERDGKQFFVTEEGKSSLG